MRFGRLTSLVALAGLCGCAAAPDGSSGVGGGRPDLVVYRVVFDPAAIAQPMGLSEAEAIAVFRDGRAANLFCRRWADRRLTPLAGAAIRAARLKTLTGRSTLKLQQSVNTGSRRDADADDVTEAIAGEAAYLLADVRDFPTVDFILLEAGWFARQDAAGRIPTSGWSAERAYAAIRADYRLVLREVAPN